MSGTGSYEFPAPAQVDPPDLTAAPTVEPDLQASKPRRGQPRIEYLWVYGLDGTLKAVVV